MYLDTSVAVPDRPGKITFRAKAGTVYVYFEYERTYDPVRKFNVPKRVTIGKLIDPSDRTVMLPNENFLKHFPNETPEGRVAMRKDELWDAVTKSSLSYEEVLAMVKATISSD